MSNYDDQWMVMNLICSNNFILHPAYNGHLSLGIIHLIHLIKKMVWNRKRKVKERWLVSKSACLAREKNEFNLFNRNFLRVLKYSCIVIGSF